ncbi:DMT family transporter [Thiohalorhabdus sp.]|uniref:DMT family transporter n=1 Tax=Thiohalorhabdus sp. TaxID=3094134 RepID=UPI002FC2F05E
MSLHPWAWLGLAILLEVAGTTFLKQSEGFTRVGEVVAMFLCYGLALVGLGLAVKRIEIGIAYAVWAGVGTALIAFVGVLYFRESMTATKMLSIGLIILGVVGLNIEAGR